LTLWTGAPVFLVKTEQLVVKMEQSTIALAIRDGRAKFATLKWFPAKLLPISEELQCLACAPMEEDAEILEPLIHATAVKATGDHTASTNLTHAPAILATMELPVTISRQISAAHVLQVSKELSANTTSTTAPLTLAEMAELATILSTISPAPVHQELLESSVRRISMNATKALVITAVSAWTKLEDMNANVFLDSLDRDVKEISMNACPILAMETALLTVSSSSTTTSVTASQAGWEDIVRLGGTSASTILVRMEEFAQTQGLAMFALVTRDSVEPIVNILAMPAIVLPVEMEEHVLEWELDSAVNARKDLLEGSAKKTAGTNVCIRLVRTMGCVLTNQATMTATARFSSEARIAEFTTSHHQEE